MNGVTIGEKNLYEEYGFILASKDIGAPEVRKYMIDVPLRNGAIDATEALAGAPRYGNRDITIKLIYVGNYIEFPAKYSELANYLHGKRLRIVFDDDMAFYYVGRIAISSATTKTHAIIVTLKCDCEPFKHDMMQTDEDWLWDSFDFEEGIINEAKDIVVDGVTSFVLITNTAGAMPTITASAPMKLTFKGESYDLKAGAQKMYELFVDVGENEFIFTGNGTVSIHYEGGSI